MFVIELYLDIHEFRMFFSTVLTGDFFCNNLQVKCISVYVRKIHTYTFREITSAMATLHSQYRLDARSTQTIDAIMIFVFNIIVNSMFLVSIFGCCGHRYNHLETCSQSIQYPHQQSAVFVRWLCRCCYRCMLSTEANHFFSAMDFFF